MADEISLQFDVEGPPRYVMDQWRVQPPRALHDEGFELMDESFNSLTFERRYLDWPQKIMIVCSFGLALIFKGFLESNFRVTARFDEEGAKTRVLLAGTAHPQAQRALAEMAAENGGITGPPTPSAAATLLPGSRPS